MAEVLDSGQVGKGSFGAQVGDHRSFLRQPASGYDLVEDGAQRLFGEFVLVVFQETGINLPLPQRVILGPLVLGFDEADILGMFNPLFQKINDLVVNGVNLFPDFFDFSLVGFLSFRRAGSQGGRDRS